MSMTMMFDSDAEIASEKIGAELEEKNESAAILQRSFPFFRWKMTRKTRAVAREGSSRRAKSWARYERILGEVGRGNKSRFRKVKSAKLGSRKRRWSFRIFRLRIKWVSPRTLITRLRDAYVNMMIDLSSNGRMSDIARAHPWTFTTS
ncbi:hypothetical protein O6H91_02G113900 [Diphasiastrum complanatum]|uniref:Uncharacterized protein n=1 Tax=Diphasiastrum complanatum TaxID=34168 RepID=A0ACC2EJP9_DIPCM|nr:hypothetical protein O6H91_02G113900 [Diphasiastrum complanatum]